jgi:hypothetical protein
MRRQFGWGDLAADVEPGDGCGVAAGLDGEFFVFLNAIIDEGTLKFTLMSAPPDIHAIQMRHLIERDADPFTTIRIVPWKALVTEDRINPFDIFEFPEASDHVTVAYSLAGAELSRVDGTPTWDQADRELALPADESRELIRHHLTEIEDTWHRRPP